VSIIATFSGCAVVAVGAAGGGAMALHDMRQADVILEDERIEVKANDQLYNDELLSKKIHANITSYNHVVLLTGEVVSQQLRDRAIEIVSNIEKVKRVHNELRVANLASFSSRTGDTWLTSKVKTKMLTTKGLDANRVKVVTENDTVYLMGLVTKHEGGLAADIASKIEGVGRVVTLFEYVDESQLPESPEPTPAKRLKFKTI
jgi:osmotically-inducible protein OsmY